MSLDAWGRQLAEVGYIERVPIVPLEEASEFASQFDAMEREVGSEPLKLAHIETPESIFDSVFACDFVAKVATSDQVLNLAEAFLGPDVMLLSNTRFFCRYGRSVGYVGWHQDLTYMGLVPAEMLTVWFAIDAVDERSGCLHVVPDSHRSGFFPHVERLNEGNVLSRGQEVSELPSTLTEPVSLPLQAGEACAFSGMLLHSSGPNLSERRRAGLACRYVSPAARPTNQAIARAALVRGEDRFNHFQALRLTSES